MSGRLQGRVAIVTGGGGGIGLAYCRRFIAEGAKVVIAEIGREQGEAAEAELGTDDALFVRTDITDEASADACRDATLERFGAIDVLVNNAALYGELDTSNNTVEYLRRVYDVNVIGQWLMAKAVAPTTVRQARGRIINIGSIAGYLPLGAFGGHDPDGFSLGSYAYQQTKFAVLGLTRQMAGELGKYGVTVNTVAPGLVMTEATAKQVPAGFDDMFAQMSAAKRNSEAEDMTGPVLFLASDDSAMVNGQVICVDGGNVMPA